MGFVLIDIRHEAQPIDLEFMTYLGHEQIPFNIVFTKADKLKPNALLRNVAQFEAKMLETWEVMPTYFVTSSSQYTGREELLKCIEDVNSEMQRV